MDVGKLRAFLKGELGLENIIEEIRAEAATHKEFDPIALSNDQVSEKMVLDFQHLARIYDAYLTGRLRSKEAVFLMAVILESQSIDELSPKDLKRELLELILFFVDSHSSLALNASNALAMKEKYILRLASDATAPEKETKLNQKPAPEEADKIVGTFVPRQVETDKGRKVWILAIDSTQEAPSVMEEPGGAGTFMILNYPKGFMDIAWAAHPSLPDTFCTTTFIKSMGHLKLAPKRPAS